MKKRYLSLLLALSMALSLVACGNGESETPAAPATPACPTCGATVAEGMAFCVNCGTKIGG